MAPTADVGPVEIPWQSLAVAFIVSGLMGVVGYYTTRKIEGPVRQLVSTAAGTG